MGFFKGKKKEAGATDALDTRDAPGSKTSKEKRNKFTFMKATRARKSPSTPRTRSTNTSTTPRTETGETTPRSTPSSSPSKSISDEQEDTATSTRASSPPRNGEQDTSVVVPSPPLPKRYILDDLNVMDSYPDDELDEDAGGMELVLGDILSIPTEETTPAPGTPTKSIILSRRPPGDMELVLEGILPVPSEETSSTSSTPTTPSRQQQQQPQTVAEVRNKKAFNRITVEQEQETSFEYGPPDESLETHQDMVRQVQEKLKAVGSKERLISQIKSFESTDKPQVYEDDSDSDSIADDRVRRQHVSTTTMTEAAIVTLERSSLPQPDVSKSPRNVTSSQASPTPYDKKAYDPTIREQERTTTKNIANTNRPMTDAVTNKLIQAFNCTGDMLPEQLQKHIPNIQTCATDFTVMSTAFQKGVPKKEPVYNDQFAVDFLDVRSKICVFMYVCVCRHKKVSSHLFVVVFLSLGIVKCWICLGLSSTTHQGTTRLDGSQCHHVVATRHLQSKNDDATPVGMVHHGWWHGATSRNKVGALVKDSFRHQFSHRQ